jgi:CDP-glucose 4,6-dehydratase
MPDPGFWKGRSVVVTGSTGFLGGWLIGRLLDYEADVTAIVHSPKPASQFYSEGYHHRAHVETGSVYDASLIERVLESRRVDVVFQLAYGADVSRVLSEPFECFRSTAESTALILEWLRLKSPDSVAVISSSDKAYGTQELPYRESQALRPRHPYEVAKAGQDLIAQSYGKVYGVRTAVTRCANYYGGFDLNFTRLIPGTLRSILHGQAPVLRSDGRFTRDFLYIEDAVDIQLLLAEQLAADLSLCGEPFNFSYGEPIEVLEVIRRLTRLTGSSIEPIIQDDTRTEIRHMHLSSEKARTRLGWNARFGFEEGLKRTVAWYKQHFAHGPVSACKHGARAGLNILLSALINLPFEPVLMV